MTNKQYHRIMADIDKVNTTEASNPYKDRYAEISSVLERHGLDRCGALCRDLLDIVADVRIETLNIVSKTICKV